MESDSGRTEMSETRAIYETDPNGRDSHEPGSKLDAGKNRLALTLFGFSNALQAVGEIGTYGAGKYSPNGWKSVPDAEERYSDAMMRHLFADREWTLDEESGLPHLAHAAWNLLAILEIRLRQR